MSSGGEPNWEVFDAQVVHHNEEADEDDDDWSPPAPVHVTADGPAATMGSGCPACGRPFKRHSSLELLRCAELDDDDVVEADGEQDDDDDEPEVGPEFERWLATRPANPRLQEAGLQPEVTSSTALQAAHTIAHERGQHAEVLVTGCPACDAIGTALVDSATPPAAATAVLVPPSEELPEPATAESIKALAATLAVPSGEIDMLELAAALRKLIESERDEIVRRGGPLEKQNLKLKEDLRDALDYGNLWRKRADANAAARNALQDQLNELIKANRKAKAKQDRTGERTKVTDLQDILKICRKSPGVEVKMGGNGHWQITQDGVFVTDLASSGGSQKVNMASVVKLRKAKIIV